MLGIPLRSRIHAWLNKSLRPLVRLLGQAIAAGGLRRAWPRLAAAFVLTATCYAFYNWCQIRGLEIEYERYRLPALEQAATPAEAKRVLVHELKWLSEKQIEEPQFQAWLDSNWDKPVHRQFEALLENVVVSDSQDRRTALTREIATGQVRWRMLPPGLVECKSPTGLAVWDAQLKYENGLLRETLKNGSFQSEGIEKLAQSLAGELADALHVRLRFLKRLNGVIQWLIIAISFSLLLSMLQRLYFLLGSESAPAPDSLAAGHDDLEGALILKRMGQLAAAGNGSLETQEEWLEERKRLKQFLDQGPYASLAAWTGLLPSLGFIGTVLGMGESLLRTDGLMTASDKHAAIRDMTEQLGYAFDTTLVALLATLVLVLCSSALKRYELWYYDEWSTKRAA